MESGLISIIVPVYSVEKYLAQCLDSLIGQTYRQIEIIIVNDGSTDSSLQIAEEYAKKDERIQVITQENTGLSGARNTGMKAAKGDYLLFVDSDDWLDAETCETALSNAQKNGSDIVIWSYKREYENASLETKVLGDEPCVWRGQEADFVKRRLVGLIGSELAEPQKTDSLVTAWGKLYRKEIVGSTEYVDTKIIGTEDAWFNINVFENAETVSYIPSCFSHYRKSDSTTLTHKYKKKLVGQWGTLYEMIRQYLTEHGKGETYFEALSNRISLGLIGIGLNLAEDKSFSFAQKKAELKYILRLERYDRALQKLELRFFPIHWKVFFFLAKKKQTFLLVWLLKIMNIARKSA